MQDLIDAMNAECEFLTPDGIFILPGKVPADKDHTERSEKELDAWWGRPFILQNNVNNDRYNVYRFDGGAWDRATWRGEAETLKGAIEVARGLIN